MPPSGGCFPHLCRSLIISTALIFECIVVETPVILIAGCLQNLLFNRNAGARTGIHVTITVTIDQCIADAPLMYPLMLSGPACLAGTSATADIVFPYSTCKFFLQQVPFREGA